jgi:hypothetical protein
MSTGETGWPPAGFYFYEAGASSSASESSQAQPLPPQDVARIMRAIDDLVRERQVISAANIIQRAPGLNPASVRAFVQALLAQQEYAAAVRASIAPHLWMAVPWEDQAQAPFLSEEDQAQVIQASVDLVRERQVISAANIIQRAPGLNPANVQTFVRPS